MKTPLLTLLLLTCFYCAFADIFVVTTNADNGPGSLREAISLANANGSATPDQIVFNIPDLTETGRTITLLTALPNLSSALAIDASTQPGLKFGVSDAKIRIRHNGSATFSQGLVLFDVHDVEIYAISFYDFRFGDNNLVEPRCAIYVPGMLSRIKIGAPGKGNVFYGNSLSIANRYSYGSNPGDKVTEMEIRSNFFGLNEDGFSISIQGSNQVVICSFENFKIGGDLPGDGNYFAGANPDCIYLNSDSPTGNGYVQIKHNNFGVDYTKTKALRCGTITIEGDGRDYLESRADAIVTISDNMFDNAAVVGQGNSCHSGFVINNITGFITIQGNRIGEFFTFTSCQTIGIALVNCENGIVGGLNPNEENLIANNFSSGLAVRDCRNVQILRNSFYCNSPGITATSSKTLIPVAEILTENGIDKFGGKAPPGAKVEAFETPTCGGCGNGKIFLGETTADANGNWEITAPFSSGVTARATIPGGASGEFSKPEFDESQLKYMAAACGLKKGYIRGMKVVRGTKFYWINRITNDTIFNQLDLENIGTGQYDFIVEQTRFCSVRKVVTLSDFSPSIFDTYATITHPSCGLFNGAIRNISVSGSYDKLFWLNDNRDTIADILKAAPGRYKLIVLNTYGCGDSTDYFTLINQAGPSLNFNTVIAPGSCGNPNGSITGITAANVSGTPDIKWIDESNKVVGTGFDLLNVSAGKYKLRFKDNSVCDAIETPYYVVTESSKPVTIDTKNIVINASQCSTPSGSIKGINAAGAVSYTWYDAYGNIVSNKLDPDNLAAGKYVLVASNQLCNNHSDSIAIPLNPKMQFSTPLVINSRPSICSTQDAYYRILNFPDPQLYTFRWIDSSKAGYPVVSTQLNLENIRTGKFTLIATNATGCEQVVASVNFVVSIAPQLDASKMRLVNDECGMGIASIHNIDPVPNAGLAPFSYSWKNELQQEIGNTKDINGLRKGNYSLVLKDNNGCETTAGPFAINDINNVLKAPQYEAQIIPRHTATIIKPKEQVQATYFLYETAGGLVWLTQNETGIFNIDTMHTDKTYYIKMVKGTCTSEYGMANIKVVDETRIRIPNAFTPNNDGRNDKIKPTVIGYMVSLDFSIYDRWGNRIFRTTSINDGWDGTNKGLPSPNGNYVWTLRGIDIFGKKIEEKGNFVLIR